MRCAAGWNVNLATEDAAIQRGLYPVVPWLQAGKHDRAVADHLVQHRATLRVEYGHQHAGNEVRLLSGPGGELEAGGPLRLDSSQELGFVLADAAAHVEHAVGVVDRQFSLCVRGDAKEGCAGDCQRGEYGTERLGGRHGFGSCVKR